MKPYFEVESGAGVASGMEETKSDAAIDTTAKENRHFKAFIRHTAGEKARVKINIIDSGSIVE